MWVTMVYRFHCLRIHQFSTDDSSSWIGNEKGTHKSNHGKQKENWTHDRVPKRCANKRFRTASGQGQVFRVLYLDMSDFVCFAHKAMSVGNTHVCVCDQLTGLLKEHAGIWPSQRGDRSHMASGDTSNAQRKVCEYGNT